MKIVHHRYFCVLVFIFCLSLPLSAEEPLRIALLPINPSSNLSSWWSGGFDPGQAITDMIASNLHNSTRFIVFDRKVMDVIMTEQSLGHSGAVTAETASEIGKVAGVEYILTGTLTEFNKSSSQGRRISIPTSFGEIGGQRRTERVRTAVEIQLIDVTTGLIAGSLTSRDETRADGSAFSLDVEGYTYDSGDEEFASSAMGRSMNKIAKDIAQKLETLELKSVNTFRELEGYVMGVEDNYVVLNIGSDDGVVVGMKFRIFRQREMTDPRTNEPRTISIPLGQLQITSAQSDASVGQLSGVRPERINHGDFAKRVNR